MTSDSARCTIEAWRERGDDRLDPVRFRFIEALAARADAHRDDARRILDARVEALVAAYRAELDNRRGADEGSAAAAAVQRGPLAMLVSQVARHAPSDEQGLAETQLGYFRSTWSRLSANRRLTQSLAKVPENAGPLNSHHLVHRSLRLMRDLSPEYLQQFVSYVDGLLWLEQLNGGAAAAASDSPRTERRGKAARGKAG